MAITVRERYQITSFVLAALYIGGEFGASYLIREVGVSRPLAFALALIPCLAMVAVFYNNLRMMAAIKDEFLRMLAVRQQLIAFGFAMSVAIIWGTLQMYLLIRPFEAVFIVVLWAIGLAIGAAANRIAYGAGAACP